MFDLTIKDLYFWLALAATVITVVVIIFGFVIAKSAKGRQLYDKMTSLNSMIEIASQAAVSHSAQLENATGADKKDSAIKYAEDYLESNGFKIDDKTRSLIGNIIEKVYQTEYKILQYSYNVGLATNTDGSEKTAFEDKDKDGTPDFLEPARVNPKTGTVEPNPIDPSTGEVKVTTIKPSTTMTVPTTIAPVETTSTSKPLETTTVMPTTVNTSVPQSASGETFPTADIGVNTLIS